MYDKFDNTLNYIGCSMLYMEVQALQTIVQMLTLCTVCVFVAAQYASFQLGKMTATVFTPSLPMNGHHVQ